MFTCSCMTGLAKSNLSLKFSAIFAGHVWRKQSQWIGQMSSVSWQTAKISWQHLVQGVQNDSRWYKGLFVGGFMGQWDFAWWQQMDGLPGHWAVGQFIHWGKLVIWLEHLVLCLMVRDLHQEERFKMRVDSMSDQQTSQKVLADNEGSRFSQQMEAPLSLFMDGQCTAWMMDKSLSQSWDI